MTALDSLRTTNRLAYVQSASPARYGYITRRSVVLPQKQRQSWATTAVPILPWAAAPYTQRDGRLKFKRPYQKCTTVRQLECTPSVIFMCADLLRYALGSCLNTAE